MADARQPVIEFVGVPGAGKSALVRALRETLPPMLGPQLPPGSRRASPLLYAAAARLFLSLQPRFANDVHRLLRIIEAHNTYRHGLNAPLLLEQGLLQRLWALIADRNSYRPDKLDTFVRLLAQAPADVIVRVSTPPPVAARRILSRPRGNSRYERMAEEDIVARLAPAAAIYDMLVDAFRRHSRATILDVSGEVPIAENVAGVGAFLRSTLPALGGGHATQMPPERE